MPVVACPCLCQTRWHIQHDRQESLASMGIANQHCIALGILSLLELLLGNLPSRFNVFPATRTHTFLLRNVVHQKPVERMAREASRPNEGCPQTTLEHSNHKDPWSVVRDGSMSASVKDLGFDWVACWAQHFSQGIKHRPVTFVDQALHILEKCHAWRLRQHVVDTVEQHASTWVW